MNAIQKKRIVIISLSLITLSIAVALILYALRQNVNVFVTPSQITSAHLKLNEHFRLGGLVTQNSLHHDAAGLGVTFTVTDLKQSITVRYIGVLPDLFREGKGVVAEGSINQQGLFIATEVLAKHDENYMPKPVYQALRKNS